MVSILIAFGLIVAAIVVGIVWGFSKMLDDVCDQVQKGMTAMRQFPPS